MKKVWLLILVLALILSGCQAFPTYTAAGQVNPSTSDIVKDFESKKRLEVEQLIDSLDANSITKLEVVYYHGCFPLYEDTYTVTDSALIKKWTDYFKSLEFESTFSEPYREDSTSDNKYFSFGGNNAPSLQISHGSHIGLKDSGLANLFKIINAEETTPVLWALMEETEKYLTSSERRA